MPFPVIPLKLDTDISNAINILILFVLFKIIGQHLTSIWLSIALSLLFFFYCYYCWTGCQALRKTVQACLIEVARSGWIERPLLIREGVNSERSKLFSFIPLITGYIKQSKHHLT